MMLYILNFLLIISVIGVILIAIARRKKKGLLEPVKTEQEILKVDEEILLKTLALDDVKALFKVIDGSRKHLREWLPWLDDTKDEAGTGRFVTSTLSQRAEGNGVHYGIYYKDELVGILGQTFKPACQMATIGYWVAESAQHKGIVTRSVDYIVKRDFSELNINRVEIRVATNNIKSRAVPERLEFKEEGRLRSVEWLYDHYVDHIVYGRLKSDDWKL